MARSPWTLSIDAASARTGLPRARVAVLFREVPRALAPKPRSVALLETVRARGHAAYCLSNMPCYALTQISSHRFWRLFTRAVISSQCGMVKSESRIYRWLLQTHAIDATRAFFIDDRPENVAADRSVGIVGHRFQSAKSYEAALVEVGPLQRLQLLRYSYAVDGVLYLAQLVRRQGSDPGNLIPHHLVDG